MKKRSLLITIIFLTILPFIRVSSVFAQTVTPTGVITTKAQIHLTAREENLKQRADTEIERRITTLNNLITKIGACKKLSPDQKTQFTDNINTQITSLNTLKAKIDADTDLTTLRTDVQSIITSYRVFALYLPQINILAYADNILAIGDKMTDLTTKLQSRIQEAQTAGNTVANLQTTLTDMQNKIADAKSLAQSVVNQIAPLTPAGYPGNKTTMQSARTTLTNARQDLHAAFADAKSIISGLKVLKTAVTATPSATVTP